MSLTLYRTTIVWTCPNWKHLQTTKINCNLKSEICFGKGRNHCSNRRKCWLPASSPFPTMYFLSAVMVNVITLHQTIPTFNNPEKQSLLNTFWKEEKPAFSPLRQCFLSISQKISVDLFSKWQNFGWVQIESINRQQNKWQKNWKWFWVG